MGDKKKKRKRRHVGWIFAILYLFPRVSSILVFSFEIESFVFLFVFIFLFFLSFDNAKINETRSRFKGRISSNARDTKNEIRFRIFNSFSTFEFNSRWHGLQRFENLIELFVYKSGDESTRYPLRNSANRSLEKYHKTPKSAIFLLSTIKCHRNKNLRKAIGFKNRILVIIVSFWGNTRGIFKGYDQTTYTKLLYDPSKCCPRWEIQKLIE